MPGEQGEASPDPPPTFSYYERKGEGNEFIRFPPNLSPIPHIAGHMVICLYMGMTHGHSMLLYSPILHIAGQIAGEGQMCAL